MADNKNSKKMIGMVHLQALPGTPFNKYSMHDIITKAVHEAKLLETYGFDAIMIENMHDVPYLNRQVGPEIVASMAVIAAAVRNAVRIPVGIQVLAGANQEAVAIANATDLAFCRCEGFVFSHVADEGLMNSDAGTLLRYRRHINAQQVAIYADIKKKHSSHSITADVSLEETGKAAQYFGADAVIVTGTATGEPTNPEDVRAVKSAVTIPVYVGSGTTDKNLGDLWNIADGFIVGSFLKREGLWSNDLDIDRIKRFMTAVNELRKHQVKKD